MRSPLSRLALHPVVLLCALAPAARAQSRTVRLDEIDQVKAWIAARLERTRAGKRELVRIPWSHRGAWACECPFEFIGSADSADANTVWLATTREPKVEDPRTPTELGRDAGFVMVAEGYFTGKQTRVEGAPGTTYQLEGFHVLRWRPHRGDADDRLMLILDGPALAEPIALADDRRWLVLVDTFETGDKKSASRAAALRDKLIAAGQKDAEVIDSRRAPLLFCCYQVVVASRHTTKEAALAAVAALKKQSIAASIRLGW